MWANVSNNIVWKSFVPPTVTNEKVDKWWTYNVSDVEDSQCPVEFISHQVEIFGQPLDSRITGDHRLMVNADRSIAACKILTLDLKEGKS